MTDIVFLEPDKIDSEPFTTSDVIAEFAGVNHHAIQQMISKYEKDLCEFGKVAFEMRPLPESRTKQSILVYYLNEQQATLMVS